MGNTGRMPPRKKPAKPGLSASHKEALAEGRRQGNAVRRYLVALERSKPRRGRSTSAEALKARLADLESKLAVADPLQRIHLIQERRNLERRIEGASVEAEDDLPELEEAFIGWRLSTDRARGSTTRPGVKPGCLLRCCKGGNSLESPLLGQSPIRMREPLAARGHRELPSLYACRRSEQGFKEHPSVG